MVKKSKFETYKKSSETYVRFHHKGKDYDVTIDEAKAVLAGTVLLFLFLLFIAAISHD